MTTRMAMIATALAWVLMAGCGGRTPYSNANLNGTINSNATGRDAGINGNDATVRPDARLPCVDEDRWELVPAPIDSIEVLTQPTSSSGIPRGVTVRVLAWVEVGGCDRLAGVQVELSAQPGLIRLRAHILHYQGLAACASVLEQVPEVLELPDLDAGDWRVTDGHPEADPSVFAALHVRECLDGEDCDCFFWEGTPGITGNSCLFDCMCEWPLSCVRELVGGPYGQGICYQTCSVDSDCPFPLQCVWNTLDMDWGVCALWRETCSSEDDCAMGFGCWSSSGDPAQQFCQAAMDGDAVWDPCQDDCDCPEGYACVMQAYTGEYSCQIPCRGNGDCPEYMMCDDLYGGFQNLLLCSELWDDNG